MFIKYCFSIANYEIVHGEEWAKNYTANNVKKSGSDYTATSPRENPNTDWRTQNRLNAQREAGAGKSGRTTIPSQQQMHDAVTQWARMEESLANSNRQLDKFNTATVVYDARTGNYYYGMNRGVQLSGDTLNLSLESWLPESSLNQYRLGNCAEVDAVNQALNSGANASDLYLYTINTKNNVSKPMCENCIYTFGDRVADVLSH